MPLNEWSVLYSSIFVSQGKRVSVQSVVEKPYIYILARSGATVKDQLMYVPTRLEDLREMDEAIELDGAQYFDELRFFSGDSPARNLESGQQGPSGTYTHHLPHV